MSATPMAAIVCWQPVLTDHQAQTFSELAKLSGSPLTAFVLDMELEVRAAQGWSAVNASSLGFELAVIPRRNARRFIRDQLSKHRDSIHVIASPFDRPLIMFALWVAITRGLRVYLISEPYSPLSAGYFGDDHRWRNVAKAKFRPLVYAFYGLVLRERVRGVFAISPLAVRQYRKIGFAAGKIFPFGYFVRADAPPAETSGPGTEEADLRLICVASLIARKGIGELIRSVASLRLRGLHVHADVYGPGSPESFGFDSGTRYCGVIPFGGTQGIARGYDLLVLPSRYDGWGVVVNEALLAGVPVLCSGAVGAGAVVREFGCGATYDLSEEGGLEHALAAVGSDRRVLLDWTRRVAAAAAALQPAKAGKYMLDVLIAVENDLPAPACPWYAP